MTIKEIAYKWAYNLTPRATTTHLIVHHCAGDGSPESIHSYHRSLGWAGIAYHYYVRKDGTVYRGRPENMTGGHTTNYNWCAIGICFEGNFEKETMSAAQRKAGAELVANIKSRYPSITVGKHSQYGATSCPGKNFPFTEICAPPEPEGSAEDTNEPSDWAKEAWEWATKAEITDGIAPKNNITREQVITMLYRYDKLKGQ